MTSSTFSRDIARSVSPAWVDGRQIVRSFVARCSGDTVVVVGSGNCFPSVGQPRLVDHRPPAAKLDVLIPPDPGSGEIVKGDAPGQARRCLPNLAAVCEAAGTSLDKALRITVYLSDMNDFAHEEARVTVVHLS